MYLGTVYVSLDLEPEVSPSDRERVLRHMRDRLRQQYGNKLTIRSDKDNALSFAMLEDNFERLKAHLHEIPDRMETLGEARVAYFRTQIFAWFEDRFVETKDGEHFEDNTDNSAVTIPYSQDEFAVSSDGFSPFQTTFNRRQMRIPTRK